MRLTISLPLFLGLLCHARPTAEPQTLTTLNSTASTDRLAGLPHKDRITCDTRRGAWTTSIKPRVSDCLKLLAGLSVSSTQETFKQEGGGQPLFQDRGGKCVITAKLIGDNGVMRGGSVQTSWLALQTQFTQLLLACTEDGRAKGDLKVGEWGQFVLSVGKASEPVGFALVGDDETAANATLTASATGELELVE